MAKILGIVNITEDSFSDGGKFLSSQNAITQARKLIQDGAYAVDLGPASSHPDAKKVRFNEEINRLKPVISRLSEENSVISVDSPQTETQRYALKENVTYLNDINGFDNMSFYDELSQSSARLITMFSIQNGLKAVRKETNPKQVLESIFRFFEAKLTAFEKAGISKDRVVIDPGMGFFLGSNPEISILVLQNIKRLKSEFGLPVLISVSRKSFLQKITGQPVTNIGAATLAAELFAVEEGADYIRTHDVKSLVDALEIKTTLSAF